MILILISSETGVRSYYPIVSGTIPYTPNLFNPFVLFYSFSYYQILVHRIQDWTDTVSDWNDFGSNFYICAQIPASDVKIEMIFLLGDGGNKGGYNNTKLSSGQKYKIYSRALTEVTSKVDILHSFI